jgi:5-methylcytosine-specific restriction endonuclease McrA
MRLRVAGGCHQQRRIRQIGVCQVDGSARSRGNCDLRSNAEMRKLLNRRIALQHAECGLCGEDFTDYGDVVPDHISPRRMGVAREDHPENIQSACWWCNGKKGST